jgi:hypothetical protein
MPLPPSWVPPPFTLLEGWESASTFPPPGRQRRIQSRVSAGPQTRRQGAPAPGPVTMGGTDISPGSSP